MFKCYHDGTKEAINMCGKMLRDELLPNIYPLMIICGIFIIGVLIYAVKLGENGIK